MTETSWDTVLPAVHEYASDDGVPIAYRTWGSGGPAVLLLHSLSLDGSWFDGLARALAEFRCVAPDLRGHGASGGEPAQLSLARFADDQVQLLDALGIDRAIIVGISLGGMIAQAVAARHPDRVNRAVLIATTGGYDEAAAATAHARAEAARQPGAIATLADPTLQRWFGASADPSDELVARARAQLLATDGAMHAAALAAMPSVGNFDVPADIDTLVIGGTDDASTPPPVVRALAEGLPGATLRFVPGGHLTAFTHPSEVAAEIAAFAAAGAEGAQS